MRIDGKQCLRVERHCPRCHVHRYHHANMDEKTHAVSICCAECGHTWAGRYKRDEWHDVDEVKEVKTLKAIENKSGLFRMTTGTRVRYWFGGQPVYGVITGIDGPVPWITVEWSTPVVGLKNKFMPGELEDPASPLLTEPDTSEVPF